MSITKSIVLIPFLIYISTFNYSCGTDENGKDRLYEKTFDIGQTDQGRALEITSDGYVIVGSYQTAEFLNQIFLLKTDKSGNSIWLHKYSYGINSLPFSMVKTFDDGFIVCGSTEMQGETRILVIKTDTHGTVQWAKNFNSITGEIAYSILQTTDISYLILGAKNLYEARTNMFLVKINSSGEQIWQKEYDLEFNSIGQYVYDPGNGSFFLIGEMNWSKIFIMKIDEMGNSKWLKTYDKSYPCEVNCMEQAGETNFIISGRSASQSFLTKIDVEGTVIWDKSFDIEGYSISYSNFLIRDFSDCFLVVGQTAAHPTFPSDLFVLKVNDRGEYLSHKTFGDGTHVTGNFIAQDADQTYIIVGSKSDDVYLIKTDLQ